MLYPAELQALPQPRFETVAQGFILCLAYKFMRETSNIGEIRVIRSFGYFSPQPSDFLTCHAVPACLASLAAQEPVRQEYFFPGGPGCQPQRVQSG